GLIAGADGDVTLPAGAEGVASLMLTPRSGPVGPQTSPVDLPGGASVVISGAQQNAGLSTVAVCNVDGDEYADLVIGAPGGGPNDAVGATGVVHVLFGGASPFSAAIDLAAPPAGMR